VKVLFLDIDGVLNGHERHPDSPYTTIRPDCVTHLNTVLLKTGCKVVVSSAWRYMLLRPRANKPAPMTLLGFAYLLHTHGLTGVVHHQTLVGHTCADEECCHCGLRHNGRRKMAIDMKTGCQSCGACGRVSTRGDQIALWLRKAAEPVESYAVVDDLDLDLSRHPFVQTDGRRGLTARGAGKLIRLLGGR
jgi:hypothetical protein